MPTIPSRGERLGDDLDRDTLVYAHAQRHGCNTDPPSGVSLREHLKWLRYDMRKTFVYKHGLIAEGTHVRFYDLSGQTFRAVVTRLGRAQIDNDQLGYYRIRWWERDIANLPVHLDPVGQEVESYEIEPIHPLELLADEG